MSSNEGLDLEAVQKITGRRRVRWKGPLMMACQCQTMRMKWVRIIDVCCLVCNQCAKISKEATDYLLSTNMFWWFSFMHDRHYFDGPSDARRATGRKIQVTSSSWIDFLVVKQKTKKFYANVGRQMLKSKTTTREFSSLSSFQRELFGFTLCRCFSPKQIEWRCVTFWIGKWAPTKALYTRRLHRSRPKILDNESASQTCVRPF